MFSYTRKFLLITFIILSLASCQGKRIRALVTGKVDAEANPIMMWFEQEPMVDATTIITRPSGLIEVRDIKRFIRLYFPRSYEELREYDVIILHSPEMFHLTREQDRWMHDAIVEGTGALAAPAGLSDHGDIQQAWINSNVYRAMPNDLAAVLASGGRAGQRFFHLEVNREFPEPILTTFIPLGIEKFPGRAAHRIIGKQGTATVAWAIGDSLGKIPYMITWDYAEGRGMTIGDSLQLTFWSDIASISNPGYGATQNPYGLDILMNMVLYLTDGNLPSDVLVVHNMRSQFIEYRIKMSLLASLADFAEKFGADSGRMGELMSPISDKYRQAKESYLGQDFETAGNLMNSIFEEISEAEDQVVKIKESVLIWVYIVEWLTVTSTLMISSFVIWTIMVRRKLYREVGTTQLERF
jgi:hypothetical protein